MNQFFLNKSNDSEGLTSSGSAAKDLIFANQFHERVEIKNIHIFNSSFARVSFKDSKLSDCSFKHCVFIDCYFRRTELSSIDLTGCKFINCDFSRVKMRYCAIEYVIFDNCIINYDDLVHNLPMIKSKPNLRREVCRNLRLECKKMGRRTQYEKYLNAEMESLEAHLYNIVWAVTDHYREKYVLLQRIKAFFLFGCLKFQKYFWGYGEKLSSLAVTSFFIFPFTFAFIYFFLGKWSAIKIINLSQNIRFDESIRLSYLTMINNVPRDLYQLNSLSEFIIGVQIIFSFLLLGVFITVLYRRIDRR